MHSITFTYLTVPEVELANHKRDYRLQNSPPSAEFLKSYCSLLCESIRKKYDEILSLRENIASFQPVLTTAEARYFIFTILEFTNLMGTFGLIFSCVGIAGYKGIKSGYIRESNIQSLHHKIRDAEEVIAENMNLLISLLADHPDLLDCTDLPEDLFDHCTQTISSANDARSS